MRRLLNQILPVVLAAVALGAAVAPVRGAQSGVQDNANFFSKDAIAKADDLIRQIVSIDKRDVLVVSYGTIPDDRQDQLKSKGKQQFFADWIDEIGKQNGVDGIVILLTREPAHLQIGVGNVTRQRYFTMQDRDELMREMLARLKEKQYDDALLDGLRFIRDHMKRAGSAAAARNGAGAPPYANSPGFPAAPVSPPSGVPVLVLVCVGIGILLIVFIVIGAISRNRGYGSGYGGSPPVGGYPPGYSGGYPQGGGYYAGGGGGGGFGRGLLGGLLGGALGSWGYDRFFRNDNSSNYIPPQSGGSSGADFGASSNQADTSYSSTGGDFGGGDSSASSGGDFGSSSDSSGGGSDFGSGGGGDFGGGGDSGGSSGGDF